MTPDLTAHFLELIRLAATDLPPDVEEALRRAVEQEEPGSAARGALETILKNVELSRRNQTPICQDTGTPIFYVSYPEGWSTRQLRRQIEQAVVQATQKSYLRPNSVDALSGKNSGNNLGGDYFPTVHFEEVEGDTLTVDLMLKGGGCENVGAQYSLPYNALKAGRDLAGVRKVVLDAVHQAQGQGCAPGILGVAIGGDRGSAYYASKEVLFRRLDDENEIGETPDRRSQPVRYRTDGLWRQNHRPGHQDHRPQPPAGQLFCHRILYVLGISPPSPGLAKWRSDL